MIKSLLLSLTLFAGLFANLVQANVKSEISTDITHKVWDKLLSDNVVAINNGHSTQVNYAGFKAQHSQLKAYLDLLSATSKSEFYSWEKSKQLAFLINAYNAWTVELIVSNYHPQKNHQTKQHPKLKSIKDLGSFFRSPWSKKFIPLFGETLSLDDIEHGLIRGAVDTRVTDTGKSKYNEPRIHFALNCASIGCPALREEAYTGEMLETQLQQQTIRFISDSSRNFAKGNNLNISSIFKWYGDDFKNGFKAATSFEEFLLLYVNELKLNAAQQQALKNDDMKINFLDYNWDLNALN
ncbi:DUF547 domain-containing protein [Psychrosphaera saromensis]|uniref:DUF547 domain-containing protein n=1 Tax=Psychrosphaera saromensis TaxID=716813 RepID=A0A2S7UUL5_9GAMM|nr:DUF547 domain-containing protein [Psychrosphaera saromensis]PQJ52971.1 DUF547 domain-containing protein [Psychrosphaera saromensis]GHB77504.1 DUF547 domain-containing protein [Psychrosphaera saromensis]GLQ12870.1 DUF547 domain-containing protein [Psychrosphaera saromensis]